MNIGILTYHRAYNMGAYLQACALCARLNGEPDIEAEIIDFRMKKEVSYYDRDWPAWKKMILPQKYRFNKERDRAIREAGGRGMMKVSTESLTSDSLEEFISFVKGKYDVIVAGSDEIWKVTNFRGFPNPYWLIGDLGCRKVSYAASSRCDFEKVSPEIREAAARALEEFDYIGVRDRMTYDQVVRLTGDGERVRMNCDPSLLYRFDIEACDFRKVCAGRRGYDPFRKNLLVMLEDKKLAAWIWQKYHRDYNLISVYIWHPGFINIASVSPSQWISMIRGADLVLTSFFHATCYSILYQVPFVTFAADNKSIKLGDLLEGSGMEDRYITDPGAFFAGRDLPAFLRPVSSGDFIDRQREAFGGFLKALRGGREEPDRKQREADS